MGYQHVKENFPAGLSTEGWSDIQTPFKRIFDLGTVLTGTAAQHRTFSINSALIQTNIPLSLTNDQKF
jgi:hypothetical protein